MNTREKIVKAILNHAANNSNQEQDLREALRRIVSDATLIALALDLGIDTDAVLSSEVVS